MEPTDLYPLDVFYAEAGRALPEVTQISASDIPEPYRRLLVHSSDMTRTLEQFHGARIHVHVLERRLDGEDYRRQVVLTLNGSRRPVEFGAIVIHCDHLPQAARAAVLEGHRPLGTILADNAVEHTSRPQAFFSLAPDAVIREALGVSPDTGVLYGRRNVLVVPDGRSLAHVLEILPRVAGAENQ